MVSGLTWRETAEALIALVLATLLVAAGWDRTLVAQRVYKIGFVAGIAAFCSFMFSSCSLSLNISTFFGRLLVPVFFFITLLPFILLMEVGLLGYIGFSSIWRYVSFALAVVSLGGLFFSFVVPMLARK